MKRDSACPGKGQDDNTTDINESVLMANKFVLSCLAKYGYNPIKLPVFFHELSAFRIPKNEAWRILFELRDAGYIAYHPFHSITLKRGNSL